MASIIDDPPHTEAAQAKRTPTPVEVWCHGDDVLTIRLRDALESTFKSSSDFLMSYGKKPKTLVVTIPSHVEWKQVGKRTRILYAVEFTSVNDQKPGKIKGSCWDDDLTKCTTRIVKDANIAARKIK